MAGTVPLNADASPNSPEAGGKADLFRTVGYMASRWMAVGKRALMTLLVVVVYRIGCSIPLPGIDVEKALMMSSQPGAGLAALFAGGPLTRISLFSLGILPYISASILMSVLSSLPGRLQEMKRGTPDEQRKLASIGRWLGVAIAAVDAYVLWASFGSTGIMGSASAASVIAVFVSLMIGYATCLWLAELGTRYGLVNGGTTLIIASTAAGTGLSLRGISAQSGLADVVSIAGLALLAAFWLTWAHLSFRELPVRTARVPAIDGGGQLRFRALSGGMSPLVFGSSLAALAVTVAVRVGAEKTWFSPGSYGEATLLAGCAAVLAVVWSRLTFDPMTTANSLIAADRYIPGVEPGIPTMRRVKQAVTGVAVTAAVAAVPVAFLPAFVSSLGLPYSPIAGPTVVLVVVALTEMIRRVRVQATTVDYDRRLPARILNADELR